MHHPYCGLGGFHHGGSFFGWSFKGIPKETIKWYPCFEKLRALPRSEILGSPHPPCWSRRLGARSALESGVEISGWIWDLDDSRSPKMRAPKELPIKTLKRKNNNNTRGFGLGVEGTIPM